MKFELLFFCKLFKNEMYEIVATVVKDFSFLCAKCPDGSVNTVAFPRGGVPRTQKLKV